MKPDEIIDAICDGRTIAWLATQIGARANAVRMWRRLGVIPRKWQRPLLEFARSRGVAITAEDLIGGPE